MVAPVTPVAAARKARPVPPSTNARTATGQATLNGMHLPSALETKSAPAQAATPQDKWSCSSATALHQECYTFDTANNFCDVTLFAPDDGIGTGVNGCSFYQGAVGDVCDPFLTVTSQCEDGLTCSGTSGTCDGGTSGIPLPGGGGTTPPAPECSSDSDCDGGQVCTVTGCYTTSFEAVVCADPASLDVECDTYKGDGYYCDHASTFAAVQSEEPGSSCLAKSGQSGEACVPSDSPSMCNTGLTCCSGTSTCESVCSLV